MNADKRTPDALTEQSSGRAFKIASKRGGVPEKCYENAFAYELRKAGLDVEQRVPLSARHDNIMAGAYRADMVEEGVLVDPGYESHPQAPAVSISAPSVANDDWPYLD